MNQNIMPRNQYTVTRTGIVVGCAHIQKPYVPVDEHAQLIQNSLLKSKEDVCVQSIVAYIVTALVALIAALFHIFPQLA